MLDRHSWIDLLRPRENSSGEALYVGEAVRDEKLASTRAARVSLAVVAGLAVFAELAMALGEFMEGDELPTEIGESILCRFADIENEEFFAGIAAGFQVFHVNLSNGWQWRTSNRSSMR